jgi:hypothetical protein
MDVAFNSADGDSTFLPQRAQNRRPPGPQLEQIPAM